MALEKTRFIKEALFCPNLIEILVAVFLGDKGFRLYKGFRF